jgi:hypothetical protein
MAFSRDYTNPQDREWRAGKSPYEKTLGPNRESTSDPASFRSGFVAALKDSPRFNSFYSEGTFPIDAADRSQKKINQASRSVWANFKNPEDNKFADDFLAKYSQSVIRGIIAEEDAVDPKNLDYLVSEPAPAGSNEKSQSTVGKFPNQGVQVG